MMEGGGIGLWEMMGFVWGFWGWVVWVYQEGGKGGWNFFLVNKSFSIFYVLVGVLLLGLMVEKFPSLIFLGAFTEVDLEMSLLKVLGEVGSLQI